MPHSEIDNPKLTRLQSRARIVAIAGAIVSVLGLLYSGQTKFFQSYLMAFIFWNGLGIGCLSALMLHHMVAGRWGFMIQRILEAGTRTLPLTLALFIPVVFYGARFIYPWMPGGALAENEVVLSKAVYLSHGFWAFRAFLYAAIWLGLTYALNRMSRKLDETGDQRYVVWMRWVSGPGLVAYFVVITFSSTDWSMSLEPTWWSTIYAPIFIVGNGLACLAFSVYVLSKIAYTKPHSGVMVPEYFLHLGSLMCGFVVLWSYMSFSQFLLIYSGNLAEEIPWYLHRQSPGLGLVAFILIVFHFFLPLFILMQRKVKRGPLALVVMAVWIFVMRAVDVYWNIAPAFHPNRLELHVLDVAVFAAFGGVWVYVFTGQLRKYPLLPLNDQRMTVALAKTVHHGHKEALDHA